MAVEQLGIVTAVDHHYKATLITRILPASHAEKKKKVVTCADMNHIGVDLTTCPNDARGPLILRIFHKRQNWAWSDHDDGKGWSIACF